MPLNLSSHIRHWLHLACCGLAIAAVGEFGSLEAAQPAPPRVPNDNAPPGERIPRPVFPADEPTIRVEAPKPPPQRPLNEISIDIRPVGEAPENAAADDHYLGATEAEPNARGWNETLYFWQASNLVHQPLYFEQAYVERYGYNYGCLQPLASGVQFFGTVPLLPAKMAVRPPRDCVWSLGYGRPGSQGVPCPRY